MNSSNNRSRVKLYTLNDKNQWDDRGTGFVSCLTPTDVKNPHSIIVKSEVDGSTLLESEIQLLTIYQKQQETLIVWSEGEDYNLALSFQEKSGCDEIWEKICQIQGKDSSSGQNENTEQETDSVNYESDDECPTTATERYLTSIVHLPPIDLDHLRELSEMLTPEKVRDASRRDLFARCIESENSIPKLIQLFHQCEKSEDLDSLHQIYEIIRSIFYLNKSSLFEILLSDEFILDIIGCLEYESNVTFETKRNHRDFFEHQVKFKEVIPIGNHELIQKIHQTYRIQYIQDTILPAPSLFEENLLSIMSNILYLNKVEIVTLLYKNPKFLSQLFSALKDKQISNGKRRDLILFLKEFCVFSQTLQQQSRDQFFQVLATHEILNVIQNLLNLDDTTIKQAALDVFTCIVECNPSIVREFMLQETQTIQDDDELLLNLVISEIRSDPDPEMSGALHWMNYLKLLVDPDNMLAVSISEKTEFLSFFYFRSMSVLFAPLMTNTVDLQLIRDDFHQAQIEFYILDFLTFCLEHHTYHIRNFLNKKDVLRRILVLLQSKHQYLQLSALRFVRKLIALKDEQYNLILVRNNLFSPIVKAFKANKRRYNLLNSAMIELFEFIRTEDIQTLINYFIDNFHSDFQNVNYVQTFKGLKSRYDAYRDRKERMINSSSPTSSVTRYHETFSSSFSLSVQRLRKDERDSDLDEENWFNIDNDDQPSSSIHSNRLFNSNSDDEEDEEQNDDDEGTISAITSSEPPPLRSNRNDDDDEDRIQIPITRERSKPVINIQIRRSPTNTSERDATLDLLDSSSTGSNSSPYAMSPALSNIADQYNDDDDDDDVDVSSNAESDSSITGKKRPIEDDNQSRQSKIFKGTDD